MREIATAASPAEIPGYSSFRDHEAEFLKFAVDLRCAAADILFCHLADEIAKLTGDPRPAPARPGSPAPVEAEAGAVPADDGLRLHERPGCRPNGTRGAVEGSRRTCPGSSRKKTRIAVSIESGGLATL